MAQQGSGTWSHDMFDCCRNPIVCCGACCGSICLQALAIHEMKQGQEGGTSILINTCPLILGCGGVGLAMNRQKIRNQYGIPGNCCMECLMFTFCCCITPCMVAQEYNEVFARTIKK